MTPLSDQAVARLRLAVDVPDIGARYVVHEEIGRGGMGSVYRAHDTVLSRDVAVKVIEAIGTGTLLRERLIREARVLAQLEHPGIVTVHDAGVTDDGRPWYAMRLVHGERLDRWAAGRSRGERLRTFLRVCDAVAFAHAHEVVHRDITAGNVMIGRYGEVLLLDWGIATQGGERLADGLVAGTPGAMAPEQALGLQSAIDKRADVYSLGILLRQLGAETAAGDALPRPLAAIAARATAVDRDERYPGVDVLAEDVRHWLDGEPVSAYRERWWERVHRLYRRNQALVLLFATYAVVRVLLFWWRRV